MCTYNGAWAAFDERGRGSLEAGKIADMAVLSENPYTVPKDKLSCLRVERLYLGGKPYESCRESILPMMLPGIDLPEQGVKADSYDKTRILHSQRPV